MLKESRSRSFDLGPFPEFSVSLKHAMENQLHGKQYELEGVPILEYSGELTLYTAEKFLSEVLMHTEPIVVVDLTKLSFIDSSGMGALLRLSKQPEHPGSSRYLVCFDLLEMFRGYAHPPAIFGYVQNRFDSLEEAFRQIRARKEIENNVSPARLYEAAKVLKNGPFDYLAFFERCHQHGGPEGKEAKVDFLLEFADLKSPVESSALYEEALRTAPHDIRVYRQYVDHLVKHQEFREALNVIERIPSFLRRQFERIRIRLSKALLFPQYKGSMEDQAIAEDKYKNRILHLIAKQEREPLQCTSCHYIGRNFKIRKRAIHGGRGYVICPHCGNSRIELIL